MVAVTVEVSDTVVSFVQNEFKEIHGREATQNELLRFLKSDIEGCYNEMDNIGIADAVEHFALDE